MTKSMEGGGVAARADKAVWLEAAKVQKLNVDSVEQRPSSLSTRGCSAEMPG
jgi:hypothetical protein